MERNPSIRDYSKRTVSFVRSFVPDARLVWVKAAGRGANQTSAVRETVHTLAYVCSLSDDKSPVAINRNRINEEKGDSRDFALASA